MSIIRWDPFREMVSLREAMNRLFEDSFGRSRPALAPFEGMALAMDVKETQDDVIVKTAVPGVQPDDIDISLAGDTLTIRGEFKADEKREGETFLRQERTFGKFERTLSLPTVVVADKAKAEFDSGVLTLTLPKAEEVKPKSIKIKAK
jgi:HSP20 family protein